MSLSELAANQVSQDGCVLLRGVFSATEMAGWIDALGVALTVPTADGPLRSQAGGLYGARNLLRLWPPAATVWRRSPLQDLLAALLGRDFGLVRVLFFDKPPGSSWALPWHKDLTVAVRDNTRPSRHFCKPTRKAGVPHAEAPQKLLEDMLTARIHLDEVTDENGPLKVLLGSHCSGKTLLLDHCPLHTVLAQPGDVLVMRPLLAHSSGHSRPDTARHRRILHLEFAGQRDLPDGYTWHDFLPAA
jgi:hypothetical protein